MKLKKHMGSIYKRVNNLISYQYGVYKRKGVYLLLNKKSMMDEGLIKFKDYEDDLLLFAENTIDKDGLTHFIDIGANLGFYTVRLGMLAAIEKVLSFEPLPALYVQTSSNVLVNNILDKWQGFNIALSDYTGKAEFYYHPFYLGTSSLDEEWTDRASHSTEVEVKTFDETVQLMDKRCFIKIDIEGSEIGLLKGMQRFLSENKAFIQIETKPENLDEVTSLLANCSYSLKGNPFDNDYYFCNYK